MCSDRWYKPLHPRKTSRKGRVDSPASVGSVSCWSKAGDSNDTDVRYLVIVSQVPEALLFFSPPVSFLFIAIWSLNVHFTADAQGACFQAIIWLYNCPSLCCSILKEWHLREMSHKQNTQIVKRASIFINKPLDRKLRLTTRRPEIKHPSLKIKSLLLWLT